MAKKKNTLKPVGTYAQNMNNRLQTLKTGNGTVGSYQQRINTLNNFMVKARDEERRRQAEAEQQQRALEKSRQETENMKKLSQDLTYGYGGRYDPSLAYQAKMMGLKAKDVQEEVNKSEQLYKANDLEEKVNNAQSDRGYAGVQKDRKIYGTDNTLTMDQWFRVKGKEKENQAKGYYDNGDDPFLMSEEGRAEYRKKAEFNANNLKNRAKRYTDYNEDDALAGLFDRMYERDIANEQAIIDNPAYKGTDYERNALARKATLESERNEARRQAAENARRMRDSGINLQADEAHMPQLRKEVYDWVMTDGYDQRTKNNKEDIDAAIDEYITGLRTPWGDYDTQADAINAANTQASAWDSRVQAADEAQKYYDLKNKWMAKAADDTYFNQSNGYVPEYAPQIKMMFDETADDFVPEVQGDEVAKAYWYANNWQKTVAAKGKLDDVNKYMFIASDPDILRTFNEMYNKDMANGYRGERGSNLAEQFLKGLDPYLSTMMVEYQKDYARSKAEDPETGFFARVASYPMQAVGGIAGTIGAITGAKKDSPLYLTSRMVSELRSQQNEDVGKWVDRVFGKGGDVAQFMLGVVDSVGDMVFAGGTGNALAGEGTKGAMRLVQMIMSGSATSNKMIENLDNGMSGGEAALSAIGSGIIEWITERYSLEQIMGPDVRQLYGNKRAMASFLARSAGAEGSEEIASGILETGLDSILSMAYGHEDEIKKRYNELITSDPNMTHQEATRIAMEEKLAEIGMEGLAGALSGLGMAGSRAVSTALETRAEGRNIQQEENGGNRMIDLAKQMGEGTESRALAEQLEKTAAEGKTIKNGDLGRLAKLTALDVGEERSNAIKETINRQVTQQLTEKGVSESEAATYAKIIEKSIFDGERLNAQDRKTLAQNEEAIKLFASYNTFSKETLDLRKEINKETAPLDSIADQISELTGQTREADSAAAAEVQKSIEASDTMEEAIDNLQARRSGLMSEGYAKLAKQVLLDNPLAKKSKNYLDDIMKIRLAAMSEGALPRTGLENEVAQKFYDAAKAEFTEVDSERVRAQAPVQEGQGRATYNGAEYGTDGWKNATQGLNKMTKNVMGAIGEISARFGYRVNLINDPDNPDIYGFEDGDTGTITINVANGFRHHMLVTMAHEMTHNLEQNSRGGYDTLRSFVLQSLRNAGVNVEDRLVKIMDNYNMVMGEKAGAGMTVNQAMAELVAQSSEALLSSRQAATELQNTNPGLFGQIKTFVQNFVARLDAAIKGMEYESSLSYEAKALKNYREQIANIWLKARKDAQGQQEPIAQSEAQQAEEQTEVRNEPAEGQKNEVQHTVEQLDRDYQKAIEDGNEEEQKRLVEEAARKAGYTETVYHGTTKYGFTVFDMNKEGKGAIFTSYNFGQAQTYTRDADVRYINEEQDRTDGVYKLFAKPGKQLLINARRHLWSGINLDNSVILKDIQKYVRENMAEDHDLMFDRTLMNDPGPDVDFTTNEIAAYAKAAGYDSVRIINVMDDGGLNGKSLMGLGDVGIFFNENDVKSADPVTYDNDGNVIPPSQRFNEQQKDMRYSIRQSPDMEVNNFMMGLNEFNLPTYQEKTMLRQYKDARTRAELLRYGIREREIERKKLLGMEKRGLKENKRLGEINRFLERDRAKLDSLEKELVRVTGTNGYARMMMNQENIMKNLTSGQSAAELEETVNNIQKNLDDVTAEMNERAEELKKLASAEAVVRIRQQFDSRGLKAIAAKLKNAIGSELENKEIENRLALIALKMKQGQYDAENAEELADLLAGRMKAEYDGYVISELRGSTITLGPSQLKELKGSGRTLNDIRQQLAGTGIRIGTTGNTTLDEKWEDLCKVMPTLDPNTNPGDMLDTILNLVNSEKSMRATVYSDENLMNINRQILEAAQQLIPEIITDEKSLKLIRESMALVAKVSGAAKSNAEAMDEVNAMIGKLQQKAKRAVVQAKKISGDIESTIEYFDQLSLQSEAAMWKSERIRLIEQMKSDNTKALMDEADRWRERIEKDKAFREAVGENQLIRRKITTNASRIRKLLINETDLKNIPEHMKGLAREMLGIIVKNDLAGRKVTNIEKQDLIETARVLAAMKELDGEYSPDDLRLIADEEAQAMIADALADLEEGLEEYNGRRKGTKDINVKQVHDQLQKIQDAVATISGIINAERSVSFLDRQVTVGEAADDVRRDFENTRFKGELKGIGSKAATMAKRSVVYGNMTPEYYIENLRNRGMSELWQDMKRGENRNGLEVRKAQEHMADLAAKTNYKAWADERHDVTLGGMKRNITIGNMMELYAIWKREQTSNPEMSQHLNKGGVYFQEEEKQTGKLRHEQTQQRAVRVTDEEIQAMYDSMTAEQKQLIDGVVKYLSNDMSDLGNEASMRMYGIKKYKETYYFPMKVWDGVKSARSDKGITGTDENRAAHKSWSKRRQHMARNALVIGDFMTDAVNHIVEMINYNTMAPSIENINKVLNYKFTEEAGTDNETQRNLRVMFRENYGLESLKYLEDLLKDLNGGPAQDQRKTLRDRLLSVFKKNAVAGSMSVALQQPLSYIRAAMMINPKYLAEGLGKFWKGSYEEMITHSGVAVIKDMGRFDMNFGQSAKDYITPETKLNLYEKASDVLTKAPELMDRMTWTRMWAAVKAEQAAKNPGMDTRSEAFMDKVTERFNELMRKTQVYDSILVKSSNMRSQNLGMKVITSFMAEPTLTLNVVADAIRNAGAEGGKKKLAKALATFLISAVMQSAVKALMGSGRSPEKKKTWAENFLNKLQQNLMNEANPVSLVPGYGDIIEVLKTGELRDDAMGAIGKLFNIVDTTRKAMEGKGKGGYRDVEDTVGQFAQLFTNIPAKNLMRDARAVYNWIAGSEYADRATSGAVLNYQRKANWFNGDNLLGVLNTWMGEAGFTTSNASYYSRIYQATKNGNTAEANALKEYMTLAKGTSDDAMKNGLKAAAKKDTGMTEAERSSWMIENGLMNNTNTVTTQYKEGKITREEAEKLYREVDPEITDDDLWWKIDRMDYQKETGAESVSGYNYRLKDAIQNNKAEEIRKVVEDLIKHGRTQKQIKDALSDWKSAYLEADSKTKTAIRDAIQKAYKAMGLTAADADKVINGWKNNKKTK